MVKKLILSFLLLFFFLCKSISANILNTDAASKLNFVNSLLLKSQIGIDGDATESIIDVPDLIQKYGYPVEKHNVTTSDGYILGMHRIPKGKGGGNSTREAVLVQHGLLASSADFIISGPGKSLDKHIITPVGYILADAGFDVWLGNARGNYYSRFHSTLDPDRYFSPFWNFSWHHIGLLDVSGMIDYVLNVTGHEKIHYVAHSQGTTAFLVLNSIRPEYIDKISSASFLAPVAFMETFPTTILAQLASYINTLYDMASTVGLMEIFPRGSLGSYEEVLRHCSMNKDLAHVCSFLLPNYTEVQNHLIFSHFPSGSSLKQIAHYGQIIEAQRFQHWDYGALMNLIHYGALTPPEYDIKNITTEIALFYSVADVFVGPTDVIKLSDSLPNALVKKIEDISFDHFDFCYSNKAKELIYDFVIDFIKNISLSD